MKQNRSRLIALLLALCLLVGALPTLALADDTILTMDDYQNAKTRVEEALTAPDVPVEQTNQYYVARSSEVDSIVKNTVTGELSVDSATSFALPVAGRLVLRAPEAEAYRWQIRVGDQWANIVGDTDPEMTLTYAKLQNALSGNAAIVRCALTRAGETIHTAEATVTVDDKVETETTTVTEQIPVTSYYQPSAVSRAKELNEGILATNDASVPITYTIIINYVFANGNTAAPSWSAQVATGSIYTQDIQSPVVVGYTASEAVVHVDSSVQTTYTVTYQPAEVEFTVKHYQQNVSNDQYTLVDTETKTGFTESSVGANLAKTDYTGFYSLLYDTTTKIAADGSTVVEIKYDRYYYLMNFDLDGGYGVEPIYARYGAPISVGEPTKPGYTFAGWDKEIPATMPAENTSYKASWTVGDQAKVTIVVWGENANDENYSYYKNAEIMATPGEKLTLNDLQDKLICGKEGHTHSSACGRDCKHEHDVNCYKVNVSYGGYEVVETQKPSNTLTSKGDGIYTYTTRSFGRTTTHYYLNIGNNWYCSSSYYGYSTDDTNEIILSCQHTHTDSCYGCGKEEHNHTSACYYSTSFMEDSELWKLAKSDEVIVAADGTTILNVYYDRVEFTLHFRKWNSNRDDYGTITAKWGADIASRFQDKCKLAGTYSWSGTKDASSPWTSYLSAMPTEDRTYYAYETNKTSSATYFGENLDGTNYDVLFVSTASGSDLSVSEEEFIEIEGFTFDKNKSAKVNDGFDGAKFYYTRNSYDLTFYNYNAEVANRGGSVKYEAPLSSYYFEPEYPADLEPNAYVFAGWYTTAGCYKGSEADLNSMTMPASNLILYAKWTPKTHTVKTYLNEKALADGETPLNTWEEVPHGTAVENPPKDPERNPYKFIGWFYISDDGEEKAFDFSMPVNRDLNLYAKWNSDVLMEYTIRYAVENEDGTLTYIAEDTTGSALAGSTKTFNAKTGTQLNAGYQSGYFPKVSSHSLTIDIDGTAENKKNEYTFVYVAKEEVEYTVRYLDKTTGEPVVVDGVPTPDKVEKTRDAVVTETFKQITGYAPDAYQKQLVLAAEGNEIVFWYTKDEIHAPVQTIHWIQNIEGADYTEYQRSTNLNGVIGQVYSEGSLTIPGFTYNAEKSSASGTLTEAGLVLNLYYDRNSYPYEFRFLEQGTDEELAEPVSDTARYQAQVTQKAKDIPGYTLVSAENQAINIAIEDPANVVSKNVKIFYYTEQIANIEYKVVGPAGCGTLDNYQESQLKVISGTAAGSTPTAASGFKFVGWYTNEACTQLVDGTWVGTDNKLTPKQSKDLGNGVMGYEAATYYAKFEYDTFDLIIKKEGLIQNTDEDAESAIFTVSGGNQTWTVVCDKDNNYRVTLTGLKCGTEYTVTEKDDWTWRYKVDTVTVNGENVQTAVVNNTTGGTETVTFTNTPSNPHWLGGDNFKTNKFGTGTSD